MVKLIKHAGFRPSAVLCTALPLLPVESLCGMSSTTRCTLDERDTSREKWILYVDFFI